MEFKITNTQVYGLERAIKASGNPMRVEIDTSEMTDKDFVRATKLGTALSPPPFNPAPVAICQGVMTFPFQLSRQPSQLALLCFGGFRYHAFDSSMIRCKAACQFPPWSRSARVCTLSLADFFTFTNLWTLGSTAISTTCLVVCICV